jgi:hypothetical protein
MFNLRLTIAAHEKVMVSFHDTGIGQIWSAEFQLNERRRCLAKDNASKDTPADEIAFVRKPKLALRGH